MKNQLQFTERKEKELRNQYIGRVEVLDKVKKLFLIPELEVMTVKQVAEFYEVDPHTITVCYQRNKAEVDEDGVMHYTKRDYENKIKYAKEHSLYDTGIKPEYNKQLLTLSTCYGGNSDNRILVLAVKS